MNSVPFEVTRDIISLLPESEWHNTAQVSKGWYLASFHVLRNFTAIKIERLLEILYQATFLKCYELKLDISFAEIINTSNLENLSERVQELFNELEVLSSYELKHLITPAHGPLSFGVMIDKKFNNLRRSVIQAEFNSVIRIDRKITFRDKSIDLMEIFWRALGFEFHQEALAIAAEIPMSDVKQLAAIDLCKYYFNRGQYSQMIKTLKALPTRHGSSDQILELIAHNHIKTEIDKTIELTQVVLNLEIKCYILMKCINELLSQGKFGKALSTAQLIFPLSSDVANHQMIMCHLANTDIESAEFVFNLMSPGKHKELAKAMIKKHKGSNCFLM